MVVSWFDKDIRYFNVQLLVFSINDSRPIGWLYEKTPQSPHTKIPKIGKDLNITTKTSRRLWLWGWFTKSFNFCLRFQGFVNNKKKITHCTQTISKFNKELYNLLSIYNH